jgi:hypothetical protein
MKRTITEILIEVEETIAIKKQKPRSVDDRETVICPHCGRKIINNDRFSEDQESHDLLKEKK